MVMLMTRKARIVEFMFFLSQSALPTNTKQDAASSATTALETVHIRLKNIVLRRPGRHARRKQRYAKSEFWSTTTEDANQMVRDADAAYCLQAKGYTFQRTK
jgi:hypothetical protein